MKHEVRALLCSDAARDPGPAKGRAGLAGRAGGGRRVGGSQGAALQLQVAGVWSVASVPLQSSLQP